MILLYPEQRIGDKEVGNLGTSKVKYKCAPVRMLSQPRVLMLIQTASVKSCKSKCILREVCRYPVKDNANTLVMHIIHEIHEILRSPVS